MKSTWRNLVTLSIENPLKTWLKARKWFQFPNVVVRACKLMNAASFSGMGSILAIVSRDLQYKTKYESFRHEVDPYINVTLFRRWTFEVLFTKYERDEFGYKRNGRICYWETMLTFLYDDLCKYDMRKSIMANSWESASRIDSTRRIYTPVHLICLNKRGRELFMTECNLYRETMMPEPYEYVTKV